jgi:hypothetical protein
MNRSRVKSRLFWAFFSYSVLIFLFAFVIFLLFKRVENFEQTVSLSHSLHNTTYQAINHGYEFFLYETTNEQFWKKRKSSILDNCRRKLHEIEVVSASFVASGWVSSTPKIQILVDSLNLFSIQYRKHYEDILQMTWERGFRDYGLTGRFRAKAHQLERLPNVDTHSLLQLRRHEKDYMLRGDTIYPQKFGKLYSEYRNTISKSKIPLSERQQQISLLDDYYAGFDSLVKLDQKLGYHRLTGMQGQLQQISSMMSYLSSEIEAQTQIEKKRIFRITRLATVSIITLSVILMLVLMVSFQFVFDTKLS